MDKCEIIMWAMGALFLVIGGIWSFFNKRFDKVDARFDKVESRLDNIEKTLYRIEFRQNAKEGCLFKEDKKIDEKAE